MTHGLPPCTASLGLGSDGRQRPGPDGRLSFPITMPWCFPGLKLRWSWRELNQRVNQVASALDRAGSRSRASTSASGR